MNPLTQVKNLQKITAREAAAGISEQGSWHAKYKDSAYIYVGGLSFDLTEGDLLAIFAQYGEIVDVNLVRDKSTGNSKGFAFVAYEDQRSTNLAVDNLNGATVAGRIIKVDHVANYKRKKEENEEEERKKREERGVCYAFQRGECNRGDSCKFSHDQERNANTGWGEKDGKKKWQHDKHDHRSHGGKRLEGIPENKVVNNRTAEGRHGRDRRTNDVTAKEERSLMYDERQRSQGKVDNDRESRHDEGLHRRDYFSSSRGDDGRQRGSGDMNLNDKRDNRTDSEHYGPLRQNAGEKREVERISDPPSRRDKEFENSYSRKPEEKRLRDYHRSDHERGHRSRDYPRKDHDKEDKNRRDR